MLHRASLTVTLFTLCPLISGCTEADPADETAGTESGDGDGDGDGDPGDGDGDGDPGDGDGDPGSCLGEAVPQAEAELVAWLEGASYQSWAAESGVHDSAGPHFGGVRTFVDTCLAASLDAGAAEHPPGAASIKELYGAGDQILGWSVMVKVAAGAGGDTWYWFEIYNDQVYADDVGSNLCTGCHGGGDDFFLSPWPLQ